VLGVVVTLSFALTLTTGCVSNAGCATSKDVAKLRQTFAKEPDGNLTITMGPQAGTDAEVDVTSKDGRVTERFYAFSDDHSKWTVEFGQFN
jgi:hypothetical protein